MGREVGEWGSEFKIQNSKFKIQNCKIQNCKIQKPFALTLGRDRVWLCGEL
jgi:hypothetical protein